VDGRVVRAAPDDAAVASYDHRVIDGADGIRFLRWVCEAFEQPFLLSLEGTMQGPLQLSRRWP
jgi:pyruvate/2-oxoglutarate dehydrogenase complex dihydrolipoamide acyltransferase (E2) component